MTAAPTPVRWTGDAARDPSGSERFDTLTVREREILVQVAGGHADDEIAERLEVSPLTVRTHVDRAMAKLGARDRAHARVSSGGVADPGVLLHEGHSW